MPDQPAHLILVAITAIAATVWLIAANYLANSPGMAARRSRDEPGTPSPESGLSAGSTTIVGGTDIDGDPARNARRLATALARNGLWPGGPLEIVERRDDCVSFVTPGDTNRPRGEIAISSAGENRTRFDYQIEYSGLPIYLRIGWVVQALALVALAIGFWALRTFVANSSNPAVWGQSFQLLQIVHFLWPPFLLGYQYRFRYRLIRRQLDTILKNLPHSEA